MGIVINMFPPLEGLTGFFFYSFAVYMFTLFLGWLLNPTVDKIIADDLR